MSLNVTCEEVVRLANKVAALARETTTEAIRRALEERRERPIGASPRGQSLISFLETQVWPFIPREVRGNRMTRDEEDQIFGYGPGGY